MVYTVEHVCTSTCLARRITDSLQLDPLACHHTTRYLGRQKYIPEDSNDATHQHAQGFWHVREIDPVDGGPDLVLREQNAWQLGATNLEGRREVWNCNDAVELFHKTRKSVWVSTVACMF